MKKLALLLCSVRLIAMEQQLMRIEQHAVMAPGRLGHVEIYHDDESFTVRKDNIFTKVENAHVSPLLKNLVKNKMLSKFSHDGYITVSQMDNEEFKLDATLRLTGGGPGGASAGFYIGKFLTYGVCHGAIQVASWFTGPAAPTLSTAAHLTAQPAIEGASNVVGLCLGLIGGMLTGPA